MQYSAVAPTCYPNRCKKAINQLANIPPPGTPYRSKPDTSTSIIALLRIQCFAWLLYTSCTRGMQNTSHDDPAMHNLPAAYVSLLQLGQRSSILIISNIRLAELARSCPAKWIDALPVIVHCPGLWSAPSCDLETIGCTTQVSSSVPYRRHQTAPALLKNTQQTAYKSNSELMQKLSLHAAVCTSSQCRPAGGPDDF